MQCYNCCLNLRRKKNILKSNICRKLLWNTIQGNNKSVERERLKRHAENVGIRTIDGDKVEANNADVVHGPR